MTLHDGRTAVGRLAVLDSVCAVAGAGKCGAEPWMRAATSDAALPLPARPVDVLPGAPVAHGQWSSIRTGHKLIPLSDWRVLDWVPATGTWRLWNYNPNNKSDVLPGAPVAHGQWRSIRTGHKLIPMPGRKVLDWVPDDGTWRLWNYNPEKSDVLPGIPRASGSWRTINASHQLIPMRDGKVLDWVPGNGRWWLWNYKPPLLPVGGDVLPAPAVAEGGWTSIRTGHELIPMRDGKVLDWVPATGTWRLWNYNPKNKSDVLPGAPVAHGQWRSIDKDHELIPMGDGKVLDWVPKDGTWRLWNYKP